MHSQKNCWPGSVSQIYLVFTAVQAVTIVNDFLQFPNLVSPNGDGVNDIWRIVNLLEWGVYPDNELWTAGRLVYEAGQVP